MEIKSNNINQFGKLSHLLADDLFYGSNVKQVFSAKSGKWIGTITRGVENLINEIEDEQALIPIKNENQLILF